jgi:hypothetical protein
MHAIVLFNKFDHFLCAWTACIHTSGRVFWVLRVEGWLNLKICTIFAMRFAIGVLRKGSYWSFGDIISGLKLYGFCFIVIAMPWPPSLQLSISPIAIGTTMLRGVGALFSLSINFRLVLFIHNTIVTGVSQQCAGCREWWPGRCIGWYGM